MGFTNRGGSTVNTKNFLGVSSMNIKKTNIIVIVLCIIYVQAAFIVGKAVEKSEQEKLTQDYGEWMDETLPGDEETSQVEEDTTPEEDTAPEGVTTPEEDTAPEGVTTPEEDTAPEGVTTPEEDTAPEEDTVPEEDTIPEEVTTEEDTTKKDNGNISPASMEDALFIGDSRTVGLYEYSGMTEATFFADVGMSVYNIDKKEIVVSGIGKVSFEQLINGKKYGKIYLMLGINEVGYNLEKTMERYAQLVQRIRDAQPDAAIFVQANLHVTKERSDTDAVCNNSVINRFNEGVSKIADNETIFYLDANVLFDDGNGNLSKDKSYDTAHILAKYYVQWADWIKEQTASALQ